MLAVGAALGGVVAAVAGRDTAFLLNALSFAVSGLLIVGIRRSFRAPDARDEPHADGSDPGPRPVVGMGDALRETLHLVRGSPMVSALLLTKATFGVGMGVILLLAVFGRDVFHAGDAGIGLLFAARGVGALVGPFLGRKGMRGDESRLLTMIAVALAAFVVGYALLPFAPAIGIAALCVFVAHLGGGAQWMLSSYGLQRAVPDAIRGRIFSFDYALVLSATTLSTIAAGALATVVGPVATLYLLLGLTAVSGSLWLLWTRPLRRSPIADGAAEAEDVP
jgi:predicted MFS family arabinose efflux permease